APLLFQVVAGATAVGLYFLLIPPFGVAGAIAATLVAQLVRTLLCYLISEVYVHLPYRFLPLAAVAMVLAVLTVPAAVTLSPIALALCAPLVLAAGAGTALALGLVPPFWRVPRSV